MISFLAIAGIFGASSAIVNNEVKETPVVEKAEAASNFTRRIWVDKGDLSWFANPSVSFNGSSGTFHSMTSDGSGSRWYYDYSGSSAPTSVVFRHDGVTSANCNTGVLNYSSNNTCNGYRLSSQSDKLYGTFVLTQNCFIVGSMSSWSIWDSNAIPFSWANNQWEASGNLTSEDSFKVLYENTTGSPTWKGYSILQSATDQAVYYKQIDGSSDSNIDVNTTATYSFYLKKDENKMWVPRIERTVVFNKNGGSGTMSDQSIICNNKTALSSNSFTKTGYNFAGWATSSSGEVVYSNNEQVTFNESSTLNLFAKWTAKTVTVTLNNQDATTPGQSSVTATYNSAMPSIAGNLPTKTGHTFNGYFRNTGGSGTKYYNANGTSATNWNLTTATTLYAYWTANSYTITVNLDGGTGQENTSYTYSASAQNIVLATPTKSGKDFAGYTVTSGPSTGTASFDETTLQLSAGTIGAITVTATWTDGTYTINYNANGGSADAPESQTPGVGAVVTFRTYLGTKTGYTFNGWNTDSAGAGTHYDAGGTGTPTTAKGGTLTLYAEWTINSHTLIWSFGTGATATGYSPEAGLVNYGTAITKPTSITRTGYTLSGWTGYVATMPDDNLTITANWTADTYTIAFNGNGATSGSTASVTATYDATKKLTNNGFTKTGHTFAGWALSEDGTKVYDNGANLTASQVNSHYNTVGKGGTLTLYAKWTADTYTVTYDRNLGDGSAQATQSKTYGIDVNALTPGQGGLSAQAWNPSQYHYFKHWNTASDDSDAVIEAGATIGSDVDFTLYYIEDWYEYRYTINGGSPVNMSNKSDTGGVLKQFSPSSAQELPLHGMLQFQVNRHDGNGWVNINVNYESGSNYNTTTGIQLATIDTIYLKLCSNEVYNVWVPGISERTIKITHDGSGTAYTMKGNGDNECVTVGYVYAQVGDVLEAEYMGSAYKVWLDDDSTGFKNSGATWEASTGVVCTEAGAYTVYLKKGSGEWHNVWISRNEEASAKHFAQLFNSSIASICTGIQGGTKSLSDLKTVWGATVASGLYKDYSEYSDATKAYFTGGTATEDADILACIAKYNYVINKYGTSQLPNFMGRSDSYKTAIRSFNPFSMIDGEDGGDNATTIIIIIAASVSLLSITALSILLVKKRKRVDN